MTIKQLEQQLEIPRATIRFYEKEKLINPKRNDNSYREYDDEDVVTLKKIIILRKIGLSVSDIKKKLLQIIDGCEKDVASDEIISSIKKPKISKFKKRKKTRFFQNPQYWII